MEVTSWTLHHGIYLPERTPWKVRSVTYIMEVTSWNLHHGRYLLELTPWKLPHGTYIMELTYGPYTMEVT